MAGAQGSALAVATVSRSAVISRVSAETVGRCVRAPPISSLMTEAPIMSQRHHCAMLAVVFIAGCSVWRPLPGAGLDRPRNEWLDEARVFLRDGTELELEHATITRDSIIGLGGERRARFAVARRDVARLEARQPDTRKTFVAGGLTALSMLAVWVVAVIVALSGEAT